MLWLVLVAILTILICLYRSILFPFFTRMYTPYMDLSNGFYTVRPSAACDRSRFNDLLRAENESLKARVTDLEKTVNRQQNELMFLQTTSADLLRRMAKLELLSSPKNNGFAGPNSTKVPLKTTTRLPPKNISQSSYNIAKVKGDSSRNGLSRSIFISSSQQRNIDENPRNHLSLASSRGLTPAAMVNVSIGKSSRGSPLRKWMSHQNVKGSTLAVSPFTETPISGRTTPSVSSASQNLPSWTVSRSVSYNNKEPIFNASSHTLQIQIAGRSVAVPVPVSMENIDPIAEQPPPDCSPPQIEWAYGYRGKDMRNNVHYLPTGELVYFCGCIVVMYNVSEHYQRHYTGHTSDVKCLCVHPNRVVIASGQTTCHRRDRRLEFDRRDSFVTLLDIDNELEHHHTEAHIRIWDSITLATLHVLGGSKAMFEKAIVAVAFSNADGGSLLACIDESYQHTFSVWRWSDEAKLAEARSANEQIFAINWHPTIKNLVLVYGRGHFTFWQLDAKNEALTKNLAIFEGRDKPKTLLSMCFSETGDVITGDSNGTISLWDPITFKTKKQAHAVHQGGVFALCLSRRGTLLSAGKDRTVAEWETMDLVRRRNPVELPDDAGTPKVILAVEGNQVVVGTTRNTLYVGDLETNFEEVVDGDSEDVTCCIAVQSHLFITASADGGVRQYNSSTKRREWRKNYGEGITCLSVDPPGTSLALGFSGGSWSVLELSTRETVFEQKESTQPITAIQFSPSSTFLFVATKELSALIYRVEGSQRFHRIARIGSLSSFVISADWDVTSQYIRGNSTIGHIYHWYAASGEPVDHASVRDAEWASCNCRVSYETGCLAHSVEGITSISRSNSKDKLVIGRDNGSLRLYTCPVLSTAAGFLALAGHSHAVSSVTYTGERLITAGITDSSLFQWKFHSNWPEA